MLANLRAPLARSRFLAPSANTQTRSNANATLADLLLRARALFVVIDRAKIVHLLRQARARARCSHACVQTSRDRQHAQMSEHTRTLTQYVHTNDATIIKTKIFKNNLHRSIENAALKCRKKLQGVCGSDII